MVDDSGYIRSLIKKTLRKAGYLIVGEADLGELAIDQCIKLQPDLITIDNILPDMQGLDILQSIREEGVQSRILMVSAIGQESVIEEAVALGAVDYVVKPFEPKLLVTVANSMFEH